MEDLDTMILIVFNNNFESVLLAHFLCLLNIKKQSQKIYNSDSESQQTSEVYPL